MKLTLLNKCDVSLTRGEKLQLGLRWWSSSFVGITPSDLLNNREKTFMENSLVWSKITNSNQFSLVVYILSRDGVDGYSVQVKSAKEDEVCNVLKELQKTFGDKVKVSVSMKAITQQDASEKNIFVFQEGLSIRNGDNGTFCEGNVVKNFNPSGLRFDITVIADISDDLEVIRQVNFVPLKTNRRILEEGLGSDLIIIAGNGVEIKSHKIFLIASSAVIERMFANEMEESKSGRVDMTDLSEEGIEAFLAFIYCGDKIGPEADLNLAFELLYASHKYEVSQMEEFMFPYWMAIADVRIDAKIAFKTYMFVRGIEAASQLKAKMVRILHRKYDELKALQEYKDLYKNPSAAMELCEDLVKMKDVKTQ